MFKLINFKKLTANSLIGLLLAVGLIVESSNKSAVATTGCALPETSDINSGDFPQGVTSYGDEIVSFTEGTGNSNYTNSIYKNPQTALGEPSLWGGGGVASGWTNDKGVSLGQGGEIVIKFTDNYLTVSGDECADLWIFEIGGQVEATIVEISKDGVNWQSVGSVAGATSGIDLDAFGFDSTDLFSYVRLTDDPNEVGGLNQKSGADIDAVGAISSEPITTTVQAPEDSCSVADSVTLTGTIRDFSDTHPDFQYRIGNDRGMVNTELGSDRKPVYAHPGSSTNTTNGKQYFDQWYRDIDGVNVSKPHDITLTKQPNGLYRYQNTSFFPIDGELQGNEGRNHNFHFTYELHGQFTYKGGEVLNFSGDDDVWVFINGKRVIDLGGVHARQDASVNIDSVATSLGLEVGQTYDFDFFFAERHTTQSNFILETSIGLLCDNDADGISNIVEGTNDTDGDGILDAQDDDSDNDGIPDALEGTKDIDGDGIPDSQDDDSDNNGIPDYEDSKGDNDGDGILDYQDSDDDGDGVNDTDDSDIDGDGIPDSQENSLTFPPDFVFPPGGTPEDVDGDGVINEVDTDGDGNGVSDNEENNGQYGYNVPDLDPDNLPSDLPTGATIDDLDADGIPNGLDTNDDGDDMDDINELEYWSEYPGAPSGPGVGGSNPGGSGSGGSGSGGSGSGGSGGSGSGGSNPAPSHPGEPDMYFD